MEIVNATEARQNLYRLLGQAVEGHAPIFIKHRKKCAVLISEQDWREISETLYLDSVPGFRESIAQVRKEPVEESSDTPGW